MLPAVPLFDEIWPNALLSVFKQSLQRMGGSLLEPPINGDVLQPVRDKVASAKVVCSMVPEIAGNCQIADVSSSAEQPNLQFVIVRALSAVIESGSVLLNHHDLRVNAVALLARHLIVLLDPVDIVVSLKHAFRRDELNARNHAPSILAQLDQRKSKACSSTPDMAPGHYLCCHSLKYRLIGVLDEIAAQMLIGSKRPGPHAGANSSSSIHWGALRIGLTCLVVKKASWQFRPRSSPP
jgi:hypothetical protein